MTAPPPNFRPPSGDYGRYETRPVYGYDDCFPTVDPCNLPEHRWPVCDHGELCWLPWEMMAGSDQVRFSSKSEKLQVTFERCLKFAVSCITWQFEVTNRSDVALPFLHVMHALMPLREIVRVQLPAFSQVVDESLGSSAGMFSPDEVEERLLALPQGKALMLLLRSVRSGSITVTFKSRMGLEIKFPAELFPTLGIWWNNGGYPDEEGCRRTECAFEPIPGTWSSLAASFRDGTYLLAPANGFVKWAIIWEIHIERCPSR